MNPVAQGTPTTMYKLASNDPQGQIELLEGRRNHTFDFDNDESERQFRHEKKRSGKGHYSWEELNRLERRRRAILKRVELPFRRILFHWDGTCLRALSRDWLIWLTIILYLGVRIIAWSGAVPELVHELANTESTGVLGGFLSFFLVLFVNQTNTRFYDMYKDSMSIQTYILDVAGLTAHAFPRPNALRLLRYLNAAHVAGYTGLSKTYTKECFFDELNKRLKLLTPKEMKRMNHLDLDYGSDCCREIFQWCLREINIAVKAEIIGLREASGLNEKILSAQSHMDNLFAYLDQPTHFYYIHFLCLLSALYLPLFSLSNAYAAGFGDEIHLTTDILLFLIVLVQAFFVIGLRLLGQQMIDPYGKLVIYLYTNTVSVLIFHLTKIIQNHPILGDDLEDLSVLYYVWSTAAATQNIMNTEYPDAVDPKEEEELARGQGVLDTCEDFGASAKKAKEESPISCSQLLV